MVDVQFRFDSEKLVQALAYLAHAKLRRLDKLKCAKLLYFSDKYHLLKYGRPILGDVYYCLENGPIPSASLNLMNSAIAPIKIRGVKFPFLELFDEYLSVDKTKKYPEFVSKRPPDLTVFSRSEVEALKATVEAYGRCSPWQLRELSHKDPTWTIPESGRIGGRAEIPYALFFEGQPDDVREVWTLVEDDQEDRDFAAKIAQ
jgi:uncharacterized phage-associated protein